MMERSRQSVVPQPDTEGQPRPAVPITVWIVGEPAAPVAGDLPANLARRLVATYSRPGESVIDLTDNAALRPACAAGARRHYRAWQNHGFDLLIAPESPAAPVVTSPPAADDVEDGPELSEPTTWFGDDLAGDCRIALHRSGPGEPMAAGTASLVVVSALPADVRADGDVMRAVLTEAAGLLRSDGCLLLTVVQHRPGADLAVAAAVAAAAGLRRIQHIVAVRGEDDRDHFVYYADEELLTLARSGGLTIPASEGSPAVDVLVFLPDRATE